MKLCCAKFNSLYFIMGYTIFQTQDAHEEAQEEFPKKAKFFFSAAVENWDAEFYVKVDDNINLDLDGLIGILESRRGQNGSYMGCMKSGDVITEEGKPWYEPDWWKFGDAKSYFRHAGGPLFILSKNLARYININSASLQTYAHDDISVGSWMMGLEATYIDDNQFCCSSSKQGELASLVFLTEMCTYKHSHDSLIFVFRQGVFPGLSRK
ncbi:hypothetical protein HHK36_013890 [Tetracentron sinense]|uniref:Hexosyltransferase n=1 Tax=Tetracentron sinense TaxID=13715 RepID=A0A835DEU6_TETSI|nr:hypothetical protein HHK36_013890 [Tetracentron sinense]